MFATEIPCEAVALCASETVAKPSRDALNKIERGRLLRVVNRFLRSAGLGSESAAPATTFIIEHAATSPKFLCLTVIETISLATISLAQRKLDRSREQPYRSRRSGEIPVFRRSLFSLHARLIHRSRAAKRELSWPCRHNGKAFFADG